MNISAATSLSLVIAEYINGRAVQFNVTDQKTTPDIDNPGSFITNKYFIWEDAIDPTFDYRQFWRVSPIFNTGDLVILTGDVTKYIISSVNDYDFTMTNLEDSNDILTITFFNQFLYELSLPWQDNISSSGYIAKLVTTVPTSTNQFITLSNYDIPFTTIGDGTEIFTFDGLNTFTVSGVTSLDFSVLFIPGDILTFSGTNINNVISTVLSVTSSTITVISNDFTIDAAEPDSSTVQIVASEKYTDVKGDLFQESDFVIQTAESVLEYIFVPSDIIIASVDVYVDGATSLTWLLVDSDTLNWDEATVFASSFESTDYSDWRLPTANELSVFYNVVDNSITVMNGSYWSSENHSAGYDGYKRVFITSTDSIDTRHESIPQKIRLVRNT